MKKKNYFHRLQIGEDESKKAYSHCEMYEIRNGVPDKEVVVPCASWEYDDSEFPDSITSEVSSQLDSIIR